MHPLSLRFDDARAEALFRAEWTELSRRPTRASLALVAGLFVAYAALDRVLFPDMFALHLAIRAAVVAVLLAVLALTWHPAWHRIRSPALGGAGVACAWALLGMVWVMPHDGPIDFSEGIALVVLGTFTLFRLPFPAAIANAALVVASYGISTAAYGTPEMSRLAGHFYVGSAVLIGAVAGYNIERFARRGFLDERALERERARSERLVRNMLPDTIAARLKSDPGPIADGFEEATVLFADIVDSSGLSDRLPPDELVRLLNEIFTEFDRIAAARGIEKIKTIGDSYMAVAGLPVPCPDHAERMVEAAMEMLAEAERRSANGGPVIALRIGIAMGPVVAGVIGEARLAYDLWGEPVMLAARMQSHGLPGRIQVTEAVARALEGRYEFEPRAEIEVKGRGRTRVWLLVGRAS